MKKIFLLLASALLISVHAAGQDYKTGVGLRLGLYNGLSVKHFFSENKAAEGILTTRWRGFDITGLYEIHNQAFQIDRLNWYYGFGAHVGFWNGDNTPWGHLGTNYAVVGIDGVIGIEYNFLEVPINIGIDWKPELNLTGYTAFWGDSGALTIRYIF